jgi:hypothetical protein
MSNSSINIQYKAMWKLDRQKCLGDRPAIRKVSAIYHSKKLRNNSFTNKASMVTLKCGQCGHGCDNHMTLS